MKRYSTFSKAPGFKPQHQRGGVIYKALCFDVAQGRMGYPMRLELTRVGLLVQLANRYTTRGAQASTSEGLNPYSGHLMGGSYPRVFANGPGDLCSIPGRVIPKTLKMVFDTSLLNTHQYTVRIKGKVEPSSERSSALHYTSV